MKNYTINTLMVLKFKLTEANYESNRQKYLTNIMYSNDVGHSDPKIFKQSLNHKI